MLNGDEKRVAVAVMIMRPVRLGWCKLTEAQSKLSLNDLLAINLELDEQDDDTPGIDSESKL